MNKNKSIKHLLMMRDIINEMEANLHYKENIELCHNRLANIMEVLVFNDSRMVVNGQIISFDDWNIIFKHN